MKCLQLTAALIAVALTVAGGRTSLAQTNVAWTNTGTGDWTDTSNWDGGFIPEAPFDEAPLINNGGTAQVSSSVPAVAGVTLGPGAVDITSAGTLNVEPGATAGQGRFSVANGGSVTVASGGTLNAAGMSVSGALNVSGPSATVAIGDKLSLNNVLSVQIPSGGFKAITAGGDAILKGALNVEFMGVSPSAGDSWDIVDAGGVDIRLSSLNVTGADNLSVGEVFRVREASGGSNGALAQLILEQRLVLNVDRESGMMSIGDPSGGTINIDGYGIQSAIGSTSTDNWNSWQDQGLDGSGWFEIGQPTANGLAELNRDANGGISGARELGAIYAPRFESFGEETEDHVFTYTTPSGDTLEGAVSYSGDKQWNNIVLTVDPESGEANMRNESPIEVSIDAYQITSELGSLTPDGWDSLEDQGEADWFEIGNNNANQLAELQAAGNTTLGLNEGFELGEIFNVAGGTGAGDLPAGADLVFEFLIAGESVTFPGIVEYGELPDLGGGDVTPGDFDKDGDVDGDDFLIWQSNFGGQGGPNEGDADGNGEVNGDDFLVWQANFGTGVGGGAGSAAVPEPSTLALLSLVALLGVCRRRR